MYRTLQARIMKKPGDTKQIWTLLQSCGVLPRKVEKRRNIQMMKRKGL